MSYRRQRDELWVGLIAAAVSVAAFVFYFRHDALLLYGDAVAHINIARRVFDSRDPGPLQLGTVWLPLPHILLLPFVISRWMWRTGAGGAIPSMIAYIAGAVGLFRLVTRALEFASHPLPLANPRLAPAGWASPRFGAWFVTVIYVANPNLIYLQTTAMTEPLYLALFIWATVCFGDFVQQIVFHSLPLANVGLPSSGWATPLRNCGILLLLAMLTRYDGWFAAVVFGVAATAVIAWAARSQVSSAPLRNIGAPTTTTFGLSLLPLPLSHPALRKFLLLLAAVPVLWLVYNAAAWGNPLEFATGPYSAKAIAQRTATAGMPHHPGYHDVAVATLYFLKDARLNLAGTPRESAWLVLAALGTLIVLIYARRLWPLLLLWTPLPFYALAISRGGVPLFFPDWWPYTYYNVRYGLQLLPAVAVSVAVVLWFGMMPLTRRWRAVVGLLALAFVGTHYISIWHAGPICLREAKTNSATRLPFERRLAAELQSLPANATVLMSLGEHGGALQQAGIPLHRTINETTHPFWKNALANPASHADYAVAFGNDAVAVAIASETAKFVPIAVIDTPGQLPAIIYQRR